MNDGIGEGLVQDQHEFAGELRLADAAEQGTLTQEVGGRLDPVRHTGNGQAQTLEGDLGRQIGSIQKWRLNLHGKFYHFFAARLTASLLLIGSGIGRNR